jgi:hypothetical protein
VPHEIIDRHLPTSFRRGSSDIDDLAVFAAAVVQADHSTTEASARAWQAAVLYASFAYIELLRLHNPTLSLVRVFQRLRTRLGPTLTFRNEALPQNVRQIENSAASIARFLLQASSLYTMQPILLLYQPEIQRYELLASEHREFPSLPLEFKQEALEVYSKAEREGRRVHIVDWASDRVPIVKYLVFQIIAGNMDVAALSRMAVQSWGTHSLREAREEAILALRNSASLATASDPRADSSILLELELPPLFAESERSGDFKSNVEAATTSAVPSMALASQSSSESARPGTSQPRSHSRSSFAVSSSLRTPARNVNLLNFLGFRPEDCCFLCLGTLVGRSHVCRFCEASFHTRCFVQESINRVPREGVTRMQWDEELLTLVDHRFLRFTRDELRTMLDLSVCYVFQLELVADDAIMMCSRWEMFVIHQRCFSR